MARKSLNVFGNFVLKEVRFGKIRISYINWYVSYIWFSRYHLPVIILSSYRRREGGGGGGGGGAAREGGEIDRSRL